MPSLTDEKTLTLTLLSSAITLAWLAKSDVMEWRQANYTLRPWRQSLLSDHSSSRQSMH